MKIAPLPPRAHVFLPPLAAVGIALGAVWYGGATTHLAEAATLGTLGLLFMAAPSRRLPERGFAWPALGLLLLAGSAWCPWEWFSMPPWRVEANAVGITLPSTLSPQPALSFEGLVLLAAGLAWAGWLATQPWEARSRRIAGQALAGGLIALAAFALLAWDMGWRIPGWLNEHQRGFGPFPNRNNTGNVLAVGGVLALGCAADSIRRSKWRAVPWVAGAGLLVAALAVNYSRGGILVFFGGVAIWQGHAAWQRRSWKILALDASALLAVSAVLLVAGGPVAARFAGGENAGIGFRNLIWRDALSLVHASPWCGAGLGNFQALFPFYRSDSVVSASLQQGVLHPESDWLWLAAEVGWLGVMLVVAMLGMWIWGALPLAKGTQHRLRGAALAASIAAAMHGLIDVPMHRLGSALVAVLILALARRDAPSTPVSKGAAAFWRVLGLGLVAASVWWTKGPDDAVRAEALSQSGFFIEAQIAATRALKRAPLNWGAYFTRAGARACTGRPLEAVADFRRARFLEPHYLGVPMGEASFWLGRVPALALPAWREALRRVSPPEDEAVFGAMCAAAPNDAAFRESLLAMVHGRPALQLVWFQVAPSVEAKAHLSEFLAASESWDAVHRAAFQRRAAELQDPSPNP